MRITGLLAAFLMAAGPLDRGATDEPIFAEATCQACATGCSRPDDPYTLFDWSIGTLDSDEPRERFGPNGKFKTETIITDRPDFTEASTTVGRGVLQIEAGYTYEFDSEAGVQTYVHSTPEVLFRIGMFTEWFELRIAHNYLWEQIDDGAGTITTLDGVDDLYLGAKIALVEQSGCLPEMAILPQMFVPFGSVFSAEQVLPGINWLYSWDVNDFLSIGGSTQINRSSGTRPIVHIDPNLFVLTIEEEADYFMEFAQSLTVGYSLTETLSAYTEWFGIMPAGSDDPDLGPVHFFDGGFTFLVNDNFQLDIRGGVGLNKHSADFFTGAGASARF